MQLLRLFQIVVLLLAVVWWGYGSAECPHHRFLSKHVCKVCTLCVQSNQTTEGLSNINFFLLSKLLQYKVVFKKGREDDRFQNANQA